MRIDTIENESDGVKEPQLDILYYPKNTLKIAEDYKKETLNVLSLFSGCGGIFLLALLLRF